MPPRVRVIHADQDVIVPGRVARTLRSEVDREAVPGTIQLGTRDVPYAGERREAQALAWKGGFGVGLTATLATLREAWELIGFAVDPGDSNVDPAFTATLRVLGKGVQGTIATVNVHIGAPQAFVGFLVGARCELVLTNVSGIVVNGVKGEIWGMAQR
jgi:hypothetical protein